jgi:FkbM family methyltransferase
LFFFFLDVALKIGTRLIRGASALMQHASRQNRRSHVPTRVWIDVGAHRGETTFNHARDCPDLLVYAFEPDVSVASHRYSLLPNFVVLPMAVTETDGFREFNVNNDDQTSSLLSLDQTGIRKWHGTHGLQTARNVIVPTVRLDTFMNALAIRSVQYLKIDAQGHDLAVLRSLGDRFRDVQMIRVEASAAECLMYTDAQNRVDEVRNFMNCKGFELVEDATQSFGQERNLLFRSTQVMKPSGWAYDRSGVR